MSVPGNPGPPPYVVEARKLVATGRPREALALLERVLKQQPRALPAMRMTAETLLAMGLPEPALRVMTEFRRLAPRLPIGHLIAAHAQELLKHYDDAAESLRTAHQLNPQDPNPPALLARFAERSSDLEESKQWVDKALAVDPDHPTARLIDGRLAMRQERLDDAVAILSALSEAPLDPSMSAATQNTLGQAHDRSGRYADAWRAFQASIAAREKDPAWQRVDESIAFDRIERARDAIRSGVLSACPEPTPEGPPPVVFLVGLPRSGTTLTERKLADRSRVVPTDERSPLSKVIRAVRAEVPEDYPGSVRDISDERAAELREMYAGLSTKLFGPTEPGTTLLDKLPLNLMDLPLIARVFPSAPLIVALREPLDACVSNAQQQMQPNPSMKALGSIHSGARFAAELLGMWCDARESLRMRWIESRYEELVADPDTHIERLIQHCGLDRRGSDGSDTPNRGVIGTPSYEAVTKPVNTKAVGRWKNYAGSIGDDWNFVEQTLLDVRRRLGYA